MVPSPDVASAVFSGSLWYENGVAVVNQIVPGTPGGSSFISSSRMWMSPRITLPTVPGWASHSSLSHAVNPSPSVAP